MLAFKYHNCQFKYQVAGFYKIQYTLRTQKFVMIITETTDRSLSNRDLHLLVYNLNGLYVPKPIQRFAMSVAIEPLCF